MANAFDLFSRAPTSRADYRSISTSDLRKLYRAARAAVANRDGCPVSELDDWYRLDAPCLTSIGWTRAEAFTSCAVEDLVAGWATVSVYESPETRLWSSMEATTIVTSEEVAPRWRAFVRSALA